MTIGLRFPDRLAEQFFGQRARRRLRRERSGPRRRRGSTPAMPYCWPDDVVFLTVAGSRVHRAGALFERDVIAQDAERIAFEERDAGRRCLPAARPRISRALSASAQPQLPPWRFEQIRGDDVDVAADFHGDVLELRVKGDGQVGRNRPRRGGPDQAADLLARQRRIDLRRIATSVRNEPRWTGWSGSRTRPRLRPARCGRGCTS